MVMSQRDVPIKAHSRAVARQWVSPALAYSSESANAWMWREEANMTKINLPGLSRSQGVRFVGAVVMYVLVLKGT